LCMIIIPVT